MRVSYFTLVFLLNVRTKSTANRDHPPPKKHKTGTSSQATPSHNRTKFTSVEREERYNTLLQWTFIPERKVDLRRNEYPEFLTRLDQLKWGTIASPHDKFDPDVVREFYANAYPPEEGGGLFEHKSWVRGKVIRYDREYLNMMLNNPYQVSEDSLDGYHHLVAQNSTMVHGFRIAETVASLCLPRRSVSGNVDGQPKRIYRKDMTTLAQIWMIFCLHNIIPNSHVSSLPLFDCHLLCCIIEGIGIDVARLMATEIYKTAVKGGKKGTMGFPSLITSLCARQGVTVNRTEPIKKPITKQYIKQNCKAETAELQGQTSQQQQQQPQEQHQLTMEEKIMLHLEHLELQNDILRQGQLNQQQSFYTAYQRQYLEEQVFLSPEEFTERFPWPGVRPTYPGETAGAAEPSGSGADEDENMS
ncbi:hypothetical protein Lal_00036775 [Lupinus albus]|nr:hypothetical protein Lal_00036775 [Lupinus albus]